MLITTAVCIAYFGLLAVDDRFDAEIREAASAYQMVLQAVDDDQEQNSLGAIALLRAMQATPDPQKQVDEFMKRATNGCFDKAEAAAEEVLHPKLAL